jgi:NAD+ kinase
VTFVRLHEAPFTDRLVAKFGLPVQGWRGAERGEDGDA